MSKEKEKCSFGRSWGWLIALIFLAGWSILLYFVGAKELVRMIGVRNGYFLVFLVASLGGLSSFTSTSLFAMVISLAVGGLEPTFLALAGGVGLTIGDSFFYVLGMKGRDKIASCFEKPVEKFTKWVKDKPEWIVQLAVFFYASFSPLPNDILTASLAVVGYSYKKMVVAIFFGNIILLYLVTKLAQSGYNHWLA